jgi:hypothetical protein
VASRRHRPGPALVTRWPGVGGALGPKPFSGRGWRGQGDPPWMSMVIVVVWLGARTRPRAVFAARRRSRVRPHAGCGDQGDMPVRQRPGHRQRGVGVGVEECLALQHRLDRVDRRVRQGGQVGQGLLLRLDRRVCGTSGAAATRRTRGSRQTPPCADSETLTTCLLLEARRPTDTACHRSRYSPAGHAYNSRALNTVPAGQPPTTRPKITKLPIRLARG